MSAPGAILNRVLRQRKKELLFLFLCALLAFSRVLTPSIADWFIAFPLLGIYIFAAYMLGKSLLGEFEFLNGNGKLRGIIFILTGFGILSLYIYLLGVLGLAGHLITAYIALAAVVFACKVCLRRLVQKRDKKTSTRKRGRNVKENEPLDGGTALSSRAVKVVILTVFILSVAALFLSTPIPEGYHDSLLYHLALPQQVYLTGRLEPMVHNFTNYLPLNGEMLYVPLAAKDYACRLLQFSFMVILCCLFIFSSKKGGRTPAVFVLLGALSFYEFAFASITTLVEMNIAAYVFAAWLLLQEYLEKDGNGKLILAGFLCGIGAGTKYQGLVFAALFAAVLLIILARSKAGIKRILTATALFLLVTFIAFSPWLIRTIVLTGNPFFPAFYGIFGAKNLSADDHSLIMSIWNYIEPGTRTVIGLITRPISLASKPGGMLLLLLPLLLLPLFLKKHKKRLMSPILILASFYCIWFFTAPHPRYFIPALPFLLMIGIPVFAELLKRNLTSLIIFTVFTALFFLNFIPFLNGIYENLKPFDFYMSGFDRGVYLERLTNSPYPAFEFINKNIQPGARILLVGESRGYGLLRRYHASSPYERQLITDYLEKASSPGQLAEVIKSSGFNYILVNFSELRRSIEVLKLPSMEFALPGTKNCELFHSLLRSLPVVYRDRNCIICRIAE